TVWRGLAEERPIKVATARRKTRYRGASRRFGHSRGARTRSTRRDDHLGSDEIAPGCPVRFQADWLCRSGPDGRVGSPADPFRLPDARAGLGRLGGHRRLGRPETWFTVSIASCQLAGKVVPEARRPC